MPLVKGTSYHLIVHPGSTAVVSCEAISFCWSNT